jgi:hypothetical protein
MASEFRRACFVFIERKGPRILIAAVYNHDGLWVEQPDGVIQVETTEPTLLGEAIKAQLKKCSHTPSYNYRDKKKTDWPAFQASGARSTTAFEKTYARYWVGGANEANIILIADTEKIDGAFELRASVNAHTDPQELGEWLLQLHENYLRVEALFE